jgi:glycosyltransferase involved in cell wall biosynthesis
MTPTAPARTTPVQHSRLLLPVVLLGAVLWAFWPTLALLVKRWSNDPQTSHGFVVPFVALFLLWQRRSLRPTTEPGEFCWGGVALLGGAALLRLASTWFYLDTLDALSLLPALAGLAVLFGGWPGLRWAWPAVAYLAFMIPLPYQVETALSGPLQRLACLPAFRAAVHPGVDARVAVALRRGGRLPEHAGGDPPPRPPAGPVRPAPVGGAGLPQLGGGPPGRRRRPQGASPCVAALAAPALVGAGLVDPAQVGRLVLCPATIHLAGRGAMNVLLPRPLRVAHVSHGLDMGGLEKLLVELARHTDRRSFRLHFVSLGGRGLLADEVEACSWPVTALNQGAGFRPRLFLCLAGLFRRYQIDVVHTHDERPHIYGALAARLAGVPRVIHTRHRGQNLAVNRRQALLLRLATRLTGRFVCVPLDSARLAARQGIGVRKALVLHNGIDTTRFTATRTEVSGPVATVARLSPEKDVETLIRAVALAAPFRPDLRLEIAGDGPCLADLRRLTAELGQQERVRFLGQVRDVPGLLARAGLFVLSSRTEGISLTLLEAMASGLPVIATRVGGNPEVVAEGETGLLVSPGNPAALADALRQLWHAPQERRRLGQAGRARAELHFDIRRMVAEYQDLYRGKPLRSQRPCSSLPLFLLTGTQLAAQYNARG